MQDLTKIAVPLIAAFTDDTSTMSEVRVSRLVRFHIERGAAGFLVGGECGDVFQLAHSERKQLLEWVVRDAQGLPVWTNATATTTAGAVDLCQHASRHGALGAVVCPPPVGRYFPHEAKVMTNAVQRHGQSGAVFADPAGVWNDFDASCIVLPRAGAVDASLAVLPFASPDEMVAGGLVFTPFALFGANKVSVVAAKPEVFVPALKSVIGHGGLNRAARAATIEMGCDLGPARPPVFELSDDGKKILLGMIAALGN